MVILLTGGAGYIGSHICVALIRAGYQLVIVDNFENSHRGVIPHIETITQSQIAYEVCDIRDQSAIERILHHYQCQAVIHLAGLKSVGESARLPLAYYDYNVYGTLSLLRAMQSVGIKKMIFSSTAAVYGDPVFLPCDENHPVSPKSVYGQTKHVAETMIGNLFQSDPSWSFVILRYFNPAGAHETGLIGEDPKGIPNNLMPVIAQVASGHLDRLTIYGSDYPTKDGTGVRDYIHVMDLAEGHVAALALLEKPAYEFLNLGCGFGYSVLEIIREFEHISNKEIAYIIGDRRAGDPAELYANAEKARDILSFTTKRDLRQMCTDMWNFQLKNLQKDHEYTS